jgi:ABC-type oligopeptide transport system substrate-binding subunit
VLAAGVVLLLVGLTSSVLLEAGPLGLWSGRVVGLQGGRKAVEEEEDTPTPKKKIRIVDEEEKPAAAKPKERTTDLARAYRDSTNIHVRDLYFPLLVPADQVTLKKTTGVTISGSRLPKGTLAVEPIGVFVANPKELKDSLAVNILDASGKTVRSETFTRGMLAAIRYYEQVAMDQVQKFLDLRLETLRMDGEHYLSKYDQLLAAEVALGAVLRFHQSARLRDIRKGDEWEAIEDALRDKLLAVLLGQLEQLTEARSWDEGFSLTRRVMETFRREKDKKQIAVPLAKLLEKALQDTTYSAERLRDARRRLRDFEEEFPNAPQLEAIRKGLRDQAQQLFDQAKKFVKDDKKSEALALLRRAEDVYPELSGLRAYRIEIDAAYQILKVGMRELPTHLSPAWAVTDAELRAVDLLFESLVNLAPDRQGLLYYRPGLSEGRIKIVPLGREFKLPRGARWSDGEELTAGDLSFTVNLLKKADSRASAREAAAGDLLEKVRVGGDPYRARLIMRQGFINPLSLMSFKVVPARNRPHPDSIEFARKPISSGPFEYAGLGRGGRSSVIFRANPFYGVRAGKPGLPRIREIHFISTTDPVKDLERGVIDLALDLTAKEAATLRKNRKYDVPLPGDKSVNRRIFFLAVNNRKPGLNTAEVRIALARAINREELLDAHFRDKGLERPVHRALNGPYPARTWACNPELVNGRVPDSLDPFDEPAAKTGIQQAVLKGAPKQMRLTVKYPTGDKAVEDAITDLCGRVNKLLSGVELVPERRTPQDLRSDVELAHDYDLAYYWYDFPDETFWLMPLLGPSGRASGENYLGYNGLLVNRIQGATNRRHFTDVRRDAQSIHRLFLEGEMPFIPLWQLDPLYASKVDEVEMLPFDPYHIFARIEHWRVKHGS